MIMPRTAAAWKQARADKLRKLYPEGYETAQFSTVKLLLEHGANPRAKGINWRYSLLPGLRKFRKEREALFALLKEYQDKSPSELLASNLVRIPEGNPARSRHENDPDHTYDTSSLDSGSSGASSISLFLSHRPHALNDIIEEDNELEEEDKKNGSEEEIDGQEGVNDEEGEVIPEMTTTLKAASRHISEAKKNFNDERDRAKAKAEDKQQ